MPPVWRCGVVTVSGWEVGWEASDDSSSGHLSEVSKNHEGHGKNVQEIQSCGVGVGGSYDVQGNI